MKTLTLTEEIFNWACETLSFLALTSSACKDASDLRANEQEIWQGILARDQVSDSAKRQIREHLIHSAVVRDSLINYIESLKTITQAFEQELLSNYAVNQAPTSNIMPNEQLAPQRVRLPRRRPRFIENLRQPWDIPRPAPNDLLPEEGE